MCISTIIFNVINLQLSTVEEITILARALDDINCI